MLLTVPLTQSGALGQTPPPPYNAIYVFGDSWSSTTDGMYWQKHWSNGPMWPELLSTNLGLAYVATNNLAVASGKGGGSTSYLLTNQIPRLGSPAYAERSLFIIWAGVADIYNLMYPGGTLDLRRLTNDVLWASQITNTVSNLTNSIELLYSKGARSIMVVDLDEIWQAPVERNGPLGLERNRTNLIARVITFNAAISDGLDLMDSVKPDLRLHRFGFRERWNDLLENYAAYGFTRADLGALDDTAIRDKSFSGPGQNHVFWDNAHPTTKTHSIWAGWMSEFLQTDRLEKLVPAFAWRPKPVLTLFFWKLKIGRTYSLQRSENLQIWQTVGQAEQILGGGQTYAMEHPMYPSLFYRLTWKD